MGQKVNPHALRIGVIKDWDSQWYPEEQEQENLVHEPLKIGKVHEWDSRKPEVKKKEYIMNRFDVKYFLKIMQKVKRLILPRQKLLI